MRTEFRGTKCYVAWRTKPKGRLNLLSAATYHRAFDAPLTSDVEGAARPFSDWVKTSASADALAADGAEAVAEAMRYPGAVATLIAPANFAWVEAVGGAGRVPVEHLPYFGEMAAEHIKDLKTIVFVGTKPPVSFFAYPGKPGWLSPDAAALIDLADARTDALSTLRAC